MSTDIASPRPGGVSVAGLSQAGKHKRRYDAVVTLEDPRARPGDRLRFTKSPKPPHLVLAFEDVDSERHGYATMTLPQMERVVAFGRENAEGSILVHCHHGVGRSAACALAMLADRAGPGNEAAAVAELFAIRPQATPNLIAVGHADTVLGRDGALARALAEHETRDASMAPRRTAREELATKRPELFTRRAPTDLTTGTRGPADSMPASQKHGPDMGR